MSPRSTSSRRRLSTAFRRALSTATLEISTAATSRAPAAEAASASAPLPVKTSSTAASRASPCSAIGRLAQGRREMAAAARGLALPAVAGVHPFAAGHGDLLRGERYDRIAEEFGPIARRQLVASLQVHVAMSDAEQALAVYNALR